MAGNNNSGCSCGMWIFAIIVLIISSGSTFGYIWLGMMIAVLIFN